MPKIKDGLKYSKRYSESDIQKAVEAVRNGMPKKAASKTFNVPRSTIQFRLSDKFVKSRPGPNTVLTEEEEDILVKWIKENTRKGFPRRWDDLRASVKEYLEKNNRSNPFRDNTPGPGWLELFLKRHPEITFRTAEGVTSASANVAEKDIKSWFRQIYNYLEEENYSDILSDPTRIYNGDETNFQFCPQSGKVLAPKGSRNVYEIEKGQAKMSLTVMFTFSADGDLTPPMVIYPNKRLTKEISSSVPESWGIGLSENGWMKANVFYEYIANVLYPVKVECSFQ